MGLVTRQGKVKFVGNRFDQPHDLFNKQLATTLRDAFILPAPLYAFLIKVEKEKRQLPPPSSLDTLIDEMSQCANDLA
ncbi:hypothetical protein ECA2707 [Pectobacterium atrosepticum SCRI1043]|uniref:Uncharacterized protein n=1 Tax=Pectobacterium atrosepticum (strain SCRI 1043 / ATCC BAA-672) TaxID=218491 RepID=Q6D3N7_PECAS|nr:hypothetical protein JV34_05395 [Pectobacterium atrosepticum]KMK79304.1 hypothetical protein KCQ_18097 [Pectobacterium atrosepticum ICMP 1526]CAG75607.1 hypothetical protein ECA2707 [Pectobacterium atrosepticum SCRI1043]